MSGRRERENCTGEDSQDSLKSSSFEKFMKGFESFPRSSKETRDTGCAISSPLQYTMMRSQCPGRPAPPRASPLFSDILLVTGVNF
eukprot:scaffold10568_cov64-Cyclotella_meneghiniana.AAC.3